MMVVTVDMVESDNGSSVVEMREGEMIVVMVAVGHVVVISTAIHRPGKSGNGCERACGGDIYSSPQPRQGWCWSPKSIPNA